MAKKTIEELESRVDRLKKKAEGLADDTPLADRRRAKKALRRAQRQVRTSRALTASRAPKASKAAEAPSADAE